MGQFTPVMKIFFCIINYDFLWVVWMLTKFFRIDVKTLKSICAEYFAHPIIKKQIHLFNIFNHDQILNQIWYWIIFLAKAIQILNWVQHKSHHLSKSLASSLSRVFMLSDAPLLLLFLQHPHHAHDKTCSLVVHDFHLGYELNR